MNPLFVVILAASLPTFRDFSRIDRERRTTGQFQTTESLQVMRKSTRSIPPGLPEMSGGHAGH